MTYPNQEITVEIITNGPSWLSKQISMESQNSIQHCYHRSSSRASPCNSKIKVKKSVKTQWEMITALKMKLSLLYFRTTSHSWPRVNVKKSKSLKRTLITKQIQRKKQVQILWTAASTKIKKDKWIIHQWCIITISSSSSSPNLFLKRKSGELWMHLKLSNQMVQQMLLIMQIGTEQLSLKLQITIHRSVALSSINQLNPNLDVERVNYRSTTLQQHPKVHKSFKIKLKTNPAKLRWVSFHQPLAPR